jgi:MFS family permease
MTEPFPEAAPARKVFLTYRVISRLYFHLSILYVYFAVHRQGTTAIAAILSVYGLAILVAGPVSTRVIGRLGGRRTLVVGELVKATGLFLLVAAPSVLAVDLAGQLVAGLGFGLTSAADPLVAGEVCRGDSKEIGRLQASAQSKMFLATLVAGVAGALLFKVRSPLPLWSAASASLVSAGLAARLPKADMAVPSRSRPAGPTAAVPAPAQRAIVSYYVLARGFMLAAFVGLLPFLLFRIEKFDVVELAAALAGFSVLAFLTARFSQHLLSALGPRVVVVVSSGLLAVSFILSGLIQHPWASLASLAIMGAASGAVRPVTMRRISQVSAEDAGAPPMGAVTAFMERAFGLCNCAIIFFGTALIVATSFRTAFIVLAILYLALQSLALRMWPMGLPGAPVGAMSAVHNPDPPHSANPR